MANVSAGQIVAWAGTTLDQTQLQTLRESGWLPCDGSTYDAGVFPDLKLALGNSWPAGTVPDLRDRFLRGGAGVQVGTFGEYQTGAPSTAFQRQVVDSPDKPTQEYEWNEYDAIRSPSGPQSATTISLQVNVAGGDSETAPQHLQIVWLIAHTTSTKDHPLMVPANCVVHSFANSHDSNWELANGLESNFDFLGLFARGSTDGRTVDLSPLPSTTAWPKNPKATISVNDVATTGTYTNGKGANQDVLGDIHLQNYNAIIGNRGGDSESRPRNTAADAVVSRTNSATFEVGALVASASTRAPSSPQDPGVSWLLCDGSTTSAKQFPLLANVIPWAVQGDNLTLPNFQNGFARANDPNAKRDPGPRQGGDSRTRQGSTQDASTGAPQNKWRTTTSFAAPTYTNPSDTWGSKSSFYQVFSRSYTAGDAWGSHDAPVSNWDAETIPKFATVSYWICVASSGSLDATALEGL